MGDTQEYLSVCPTFSTYSSDNLAEIAARVTDEFRRETEFAQQNLRDNEDDDFEFSLVRDGPEDCYDGQFRPIFPIFNRDFQSDGDRDLDGNNKQPTSEVVEGETGIPLKNLFLQDKEEREPPSSSSSSSSEGDELESIPPETYCVWRPKKVESSSPSGCKKSSSSGSASKRWKFLDLLRRSNSEGNKDSYVLLTPKHVEATKSEKHGNPKAKQTSGGVVKEANKSKSKGVGASPPPSSAHEALYVRNRAIKQGDKKKSYLPYRQELVGFFANGNSFSRTFPSF